MRVVQLGPWPPPYGGVQANLAGIRRRLRERGHFCAILNLTRSRREEADDVYFPKSPWAVLWRMAALRPDIVHLHIGGSLTPRLLALALVASALPRSRSVLSFHSGGYPSSPEGLAARPGTLRGAVFRRLDRIIAVNPAIEKLFHRFGVPPERVRLIYPYETPQAPRVDYPERLQAFLAAHRPFLFTVGLLEPEYDLPLQIEALGGVRRRFPAAGLVIAGSGSLESELRDRIAAQPWARDILLWGDMPHPVTLRAIAECDALLRTTHYDGDSIAVREALALRTPVIATDNGMRPAGVRLIPARDAGALVEAVRAVLEESGPRPAPAAADESNLDAVLALYEELLAGG